MKRQAGSSHEAGLDTPRVVGSAPAMAAALLAILLWSATAWLGVRLGQVPPLFLMGTGLILGGSLGAVRSLGPRPTLGPLLLGVYGLLGSNLLFVVALRYAPPMEVALLNYLWPLLIVALTPVFFAQTRLRLTHVVALVLGGGGAVLIMTGGHVAFSRHYLPGYLLACGAAAVWSTYSLLAKRTPGFSSAVVSWSGLLGGAIALALHFALEPGYSPPRTDYLFLLFFGIGPLGLAFVFWERAMRLGDPRTIGSIAYLTPLLSTVVLRVTGRAQFTGIIWLAMALIIAGCVLGSITRPRQTSAPPPPARS